MVFQCLEFYYLKCGCGRIYFEKKGSFSCGHSGFKGEDDGTMCFQCEDRYKLYYITHNHLIKCPLCGESTEYARSEPEVKMVNRTDIVELNKGTIPPPQQSIRFVENILAKYPDAKFNF